MIKELTLDPQKHYCEVGCYEIDYLFWRKEIEAGERVTLVEPMKRCAEMIREYIKDKPNIVFYEVAIGDFNGESNLWLEGREGGGASSYLEESEAVCPAVVNGYYNNDAYPKLPEHRQSVKVVTFDKIDLDSSITHLKVDAEGCEWFILKYLQSRPIYLRLEMKWDNWTNPYFDEINKWTLDNDYILKEVNGADWVWQYIEHKTS